MKKEILIILLLLLLTIPAVKALFIPGGFTSHDLTHHVIRQISMDKLLSEGQFPPRWSGELNNGYGYPVFLFNYPLPAMVGEVLHKLGLGYVDSVKAVLFLSMVISVLGMYLFLNAFLKDRLAAFLGAMFYLYAPLRFLTVYVSAAVGSALGFAIVPFVFWSVVEIKNGKKWAVLVGGLSLASLILAHNITALIFAPVILAFSWVILRQRFGQVGGRKVMREIWVMVLLGLGLSAWFWLPALLEAQYTRFGEIFGAFYKDQFPSLWQLIRSPWGYGLSHPQNPESGDMSYQLGLIHIGVMVVWVVLFFLSFLRKQESNYLYRFRIKQFGPELTAEGSGMTKEDRKWVAFCLISFLLSVFLMLKISLPLWENIPFLSMVQFPLRLQAWSIFAASIAAALLVKYLPFKKFLVLSLLFLVMYANRNHWNINEVFDPGEEYYLYLKTTSTSYGEHLPIWGAVLDRESPIKLEFIRGSGEIKVISNQSAKVWAEVEATTSGRVRLNQFYFPGWEIKIDDKKVDFDYLSDRESYGLMIFDIEEGIHLVKAQFKNTPVRNLADGISILSVLMFLYASYQLRAHKR